MGSDTVSAAAYVFIHRRDTMSDEYSGLAKIAIGFAAMALTGIAIRAVEFLMKLEPFRKLVAGASIVLLIIMGAYMVGELVTSGYTVLKA